MVLVYAYSSMRRVMSVNSKTTSVDGVARLSMNIFEDLNLSLKM